MIGIGNDHAGVELKNEILAYFDNAGIEYENIGTDTSDSVDYPVIAKEIANGVKNKKYEKGIIICGTGIGVCITANKVKGVRAALCGDVFSAKATREHNDANVLTLGARVIGPSLAIEIVKAFLETPFSNEQRHIRRINMIEQD